jgi:hypothetical protein
MLRRHKVMARATLRVVAVEPHGSGMRIGMQAIEDGNEPELGVCTLDMVQPLKEGGSGYQVGDTYSLSLTKTSRKTSEELTEALPVDLAPLSPEEGPPTS